VEIYTDTAAGYVTIETNGGNGNKGQNGANGRKGADSQHKVTPHPPHPKQKNIALTITSLNVKFPCLTFSV